MGKKKNKRGLYTAIIILLAVLTGCGDGNQTTTYTLSLTLTDAAAYNGASFGVALYTAGADPETAQTIAEDGEIIVSGTALVTGTAPAGTYDLYAIIDEDNDGTLDDGEKYYVVENFVVNSNKTDSITPADMTVYSGS
jgi:uncharacterized protein (DUF2141 family)